MLGLRAWLVVLLIGGAAALAHAEEFIYLPEEAAGRVRCGAAPERWVQVDFDDRDWKEWGALPDGGAACPQTRYHRWRFDAGPERARLATLTLRARYEHGFAAYLNGVEIVRRRLAPGAGAEALASETNGPEAERSIVKLRPGALRSSGNVLAIEIHPRTSGREPLLAVELSGADGARIVRGPYLQRLSEREVTVVFDTDLPTLGEVRWGPTTDYGSVTTDAPARRHHALRLRGLEPGTAYHYRVAARGSSSAPLAVMEGTPLPVAGTIDAGDAGFRTLPGPGRPLRFVVYGDVRSGHEIHAQLARTLLQEDPDLALLTGDLVDRGSDQGDWDRFFEIAAELLRQVALFPAPGNHEYARLGRGAALFYALFRWPLRPGETDAGYYSFDAAGVHFVALDSNQFRSPRQLAWLERDLADARRKGARAIFAYCHEGPWASGMHGDSAVAIHDYVPVLERHGVNAIFSGHDHHYERGRVGRLDYIVTGGGGAGLRGQRCGPSTRRACAPRVRAIANEHHYVSVEVLPSFYRLCPRRVDHSPIEPCVTVPLEP